MWLPERAAAMAGSVGAMSESEKPQEERLDPKEAMRQALERKKQREHFSSSHGIDAERGEGHSQGPAAHKREFRRKSG